ncbi:hypothetical protein B5F83_02335 [Muribaculum sp. An289]|jgi:hypothetical protein|uniref:6-phosphogluconate dehydrogenase n=1 Tax=Candidatus Merdivivens faecigallinarum TaxID=2840871 RepID=A0A9D9J029_9BACT|nr:MULTISPECIES: hypothetical protein [unclassified Muribaculum]MBO8481740.1 hypothetical protein [Candidatus Merdivivens faecigallinarum]OUO38091.1 hypothetical protein B5F83_02335 [Muribaculum sp. An289]OUO44255.1 hypothetical protein B5F81_00510 [Muribaculum sp. An287]
MASVKRKIIIAVSVIAAVALAAFVYFKFYFVFGEGVKAGNLNFVVYKGYVFKTYEGKIIQAGFTGRNNTTSIQSYEFEFSITDENIADSLMRCGGRDVELHYKEYLGALPWRGMQKYVVDGIIAVK